MAMRDEYRINEEKQTKKAETPRQRKLMVVKSNTVIRACELFNEITSNLKELNSIELPEMDYEEKLRMVCILMKAKSVIDDAGELIIESRKRLYEAYDIAIDESELGFTSSRSTAPYDGGDEE